MIASSHSKEIFDLDTKRVVNVATLSIAIAASATFITLFRVPNGYNFFLDSVDMLNLTTSGALFATFSTAGEYSSSRISIYTNGTAANTYKTFNITTQTQTRIWQTSGTNFQINYTNSSTAFTLKTIVKGFLVQA